MSHEKHSSLLSYVRRGIGEGEFIVKRGIFQPNAPVSSRLGVCSTNDRSRDLTANTMFVVRSQICNATRFVWDDKGKVKL